MHTHDNALTAGLPSASSRDLPQNPASPLEAQLAARSADLDICNNMQTAKHNPSFGTYTSPPALGFTIIWSRLLFLLYHAISRPPGRLDLACDQQQERECDQVESYRL